MEENIRKFKLIKEYPNSPKLGSIMEYYSNWNMYGINQICYYNKSVVENNPEYWQEITEYNLTYCNLVNGQYYTTYYKGQGLYTFKQGFNLWISHENKIVITSNSGNITPQNGFHEFRLATKEEINLLKEELPVGTKIVDTNPDTEGYTYTKQKDGRWKMNNIDMFSIAESSIGEGKRFRLVEEKPKKEYEILEYEYLVTKERVTLRKNGTYYAKEHLGDDVRGATLEEFYSFYSPDTHRIISIKRLSDNEIFSIGDNVQYDPSNKYTKYPEYNKPYKIDKFHFDSLGRLVAKGYNEIDNITNDACVIESKNFRKVERVPLFKSENGVDMYIGDRYFRIISNWEIQEENVIQLGEHIYKNDTIKRFSTKEKALEYIIENKPCLSYNDIKDIAFGLFMNVSSGKTFFNEEAVKELVKSKLK